MEPAEDGNITVRLRMGSTKKEDLDGKWRRRMKGFVSNVVEKYTRESRKGESSLRKKLESGEEAV